MGREPRSAPEIDPYGPTTRSQPGSSSRTRSPGRGDAAGACRLERRAHPNPAGEDRPGRGPGGGPGLRDRVRRDEDPRARVRGRRGHHPSGRSRARPGSAPGEAGADHEALQPADGAAELPPAPVRARSGEAFETARRDLPERRRDDARRAHLVRERGGHDRAARLPQRRRHAGSPHLSRGEQGEGADPDRACEDGGHEGQGGDGHAHDRRPHGTGAERAGPPARQPAASRLGEEQEAGEARVCGGRQERVPARGCGPAGCERPTRRAALGHRLRRPTTARPPRVV